MRATAAILSIITGGVFLLPSIDYESSCSALLHRKSSEIHTILLLCTIACSEQCHEMGSVFFLFAVLFSTSSPVAAQDFLGREKGGSWKARRHTGSCPRIVAHAHPGESLRHKQVTCMATNGGGCCNGVCHIIISTRAVSSQDERRAAEAPGVSIANFVIVIFHHFGLIKDSIKKALHVKPSTAAKERPSPENTGGSRVQQW